MISVTIPVVHGRHLYDVISSVQSSESVDYEIVVNDSSGPKFQASVRETLSKFSNVRVVHEVARTLHSRSMMAEMSRGDHVLLLDETRTIHPVLLRRLSESNADLAFIGEEEVGSAVWARWAQIDKQEANQLSCDDLNPSRQLFCLPRYYEKDLLRSAYSAARRKLGEELFLKVTTSELEIPFIEAFKRSKLRAVIGEPLIRHFADESLWGFVKKYYRYGYGAKMITGTGYSVILNPGTHRRPGTVVPLKSRLKIDLMLLLRGLPFALGFYL